MKRLRCENYILTCIKVLSDKMAGDAGIELMAIAASHPFKTRRCVADLV